MSLTTTALHLITRSLKNIGVLGVSDVPSADMAADAFQTLNEIVDSWNNLPLTVLNLDRTVYDMVADQATYTIGPTVLTPDWETGTLPRPTKLDNAALLLNSSTPPTEIPLGFLTDDAYQSIQPKTLTNPLPTQIYYNPTDPLGTVFLWPVPTDASNQIVLYTQAFFRQFTTLTASVVLPPGYLRALRYNLAVELAPDFGRELNPIIAERAETSLRDVKIENAKMTDLSMDLGLVPRPGGSWNIFVGP